MKSINFILLPFFMILASLFFISLNADNVYASDTHSSHGERAAEAGHGAHDELPGEVPFDRPVEEIEGSLAPMNELLLYPCSDCHDEDWEADNARRELEDPHSEIPGGFVNHDAGNRWCLDCHSAGKRDRLRLINGKLIKFNEYYKLCEQCHRRIYREWKMGVHGKRTGHWNGEKEYMHCTQCHNPHNPPFKPIKPKPAPRKPLHVKAPSGEDAHSSSTDTH